MTYAPGHPQKSRLGGRVEKVRLTAALGHRSVAPGGWFPRFPADTTSKAHSLARASGRRHSKCRTPKEFLRLHPFPYHRGEAGEIQDHPSPLLHSRRCSSKGTKPVARASCPCPKSLGRHWNDPSSWDTARDGCATVPGSRQDAQRGTGILPVSQVTGTNLARRISVVS